MTTKLSIADKARRLIAYATGEEYGDGTVVMDISHEYAEPGYSTRFAEQGLIVFGNWNDTQPYAKRGEPLTPSESMPARLARSLERVGAEIEWYDEWTTCQGCYRAVRTQPDSYSWRPSFAVVDCELLCTDCLREMGSYALIDNINNSDKCVTWCEPAHVVSLGFIKWEPGNEHTYESGWHPGQTDNPKTILDEIHNVHENAQVVFFLDESSQFYVKFLAYYKLGELIESDDDE